jgi:hypothetical protein
VGGVPRWLLDLIVYFIGAVIIVVILAGCARGGANQRPKAAKRTTASDEGRIGARVAQKGSKNDPNDLVLCHGSSERVSGTVAPSKPAIVRTPELRTRSRWARGRP